MKTIPHVLSVFCLFFLLISCEEDGEEVLTGSEVSISDIQGTWNATSAIFDIVGEGESQRVDVVEIGGTVVLVIQSNGRFTLTVSELGESPDVVTGQMSFNSETLVVEYDDSPGETELFGIQFTTNTLAIQGQALFDFDDDGTEEPAQIDFDFVRA